MVKTQNNDIISKFIFEQPHVVAKVLKDSGVFVKSPLTLPAITEATFKALYDQNETFIKNLDFAIAQEGYNNIAPIIVGAAISGITSIAGSIFGSRAAKKARQLQYNIAMANLSQQRLLEQEKIRTGAETERTKILLQTLQQYQSDLQSQGTQRIKDTYLYVGMLGVSIAIIYGVSILLQKDNG